ncbi:MAG: hypothetical protein IKS87_06845 [Lachnospiraceae bacterium]|nr:hypothetical protein [Lachnospiraceae bacterium]
MDDFRELLKSVDRSYDGFVHAVMSYVKTPGNEDKKELIERYLSRKTSLITQALKNGRTCEEIA